MSAMSIEIEKKNDTTDRKRIKFTYHEPWQCLERIENYKG